MRYVFLFIFYFLTVELIAQQQVTISGYIRDAESSENLYWASVLEKTTKGGTVSNAYGFYSLTVPVGHLELAVSYVGYLPEKKMLFLESDTTINFNLKTNNQLEEVVVGAPQSRKGNSYQGHRQIDMAQIKELPGFLGEQDVLKGLAVLPGVQQGYEGSAGIYVRGGSPDQNLILLDDVPIYNASHLFGFVSVFTPEALQRVDFYKGGFPARYGGRLSSVVDVRMKEGNRHKRQTDLTLGIISSKLTHEGPIKEGKSSYLISARRTLLDLFVTGGAKLAELSSDEAIVPGLNFYDFNGKLNFDFDDRNRLYVSLYFGGDHLFSRFSTKHVFENGETKQKTKVGLKWGNAIASIRWNHQLGSRLFLNTTVSTGNFRYNVHNYYNQLTTKGRDEERASSDIYYKTRVNNNNLKLLFDWYVSGTHRLQFGSSASLNYYMPGEQEIEKEDGTQVKRGNGRQTTTELSVFADDQIKLGDFAQLYLGVRGDFFETDGKWFTYWLPRANLQLQFHPAYSINLSYAEMAQPLHLLTNSSIGLPSDIWVPATKQVAPEFSRQYTFGTTIELNDRLNYSMDAYYKTMKGVINYRAGYSFMDIYDDWEQLVEKGKGEAWGVEQAIRYESTNWKAWMNYTLAWNNRQFEHINAGKAFPFKFDRRHDVNLGFVCKLNRRVDFTAMWVYQTGQAVTLAQQDFRAEGGIDYTIYDFITGFEIDNPGRIQYVEGYNNYRLPAFHHLDVGFTFTRKQRNRLHEWKIGAYNVYARQNPYMYYPETNADGVRRYKQISLFPFIPSISYHVKF